MPAKRKGERKRKQRKKKRRIPSLSARHSKAHTRGLGCNIQSTLCEGPLSCRVRIRIRRRHIWRSKGEDVPESHTAVGAAADIYRGFGWKAQRKRRSVASRARPRKITGTDALFALGGDSVGNGNWRKQSLEGKHHGQTLYIYFIYQVSTPAAAAAAAAFLSRPNLYITVRARWSMSLLCVSALFWISISSPRCIHNGSLVLLI